MVVYLASSRAGLEMPCGVLMSMRAQKTASVWVAVRLLQAQERFSEVLELLDSMVEIARSRSDKQILLQIERQRYRIRDELGLR
jgi:hypothetical protein